MRPATRMPKPPMTYTYTVAPQQRLSAMITATLEAFKHADALRRANNTFGPRELAEFERAYNTLGKLYDKLTRLQDSVTRRV